MMKKFFIIVLTLFCVLKISAQDSLLVKEAYEQVEMFVTKRAFVVSYKAFYKIEAGGSEGVFVNSVFSGGRTDNSTFTLYVNPYMVVNNGGIYTKHIYAGAERVVSKMGDPASYGADPRRIAKAGDFLPADKKPDYAAKYKAGQIQVRNNYANFEVEFLGVDNDDYVNGEGFCCGDNASSKYAPFGGNIGAGNDSYENIQYYYHYDHLGSVTAITDLYGNIVQRADYIPTGEVFMEERNNSLTTSYLFNAKELDEETGLYYYGARYYNPRESVWLSVDPLATYDPIMNSEHFIDGEHNDGVFNERNLNPYIYCYNNPVLYVDPNGKQSIFQSKVDGSGNRYFEYFGEGTNKSVGSMVWVYDNSNKKIINSILGADAPGKTVAQYGTHYLKEREHISALDATAEVAKIAWEGEDSRLVLTMPFQALAFAKIESIFSAGSLLDDVAVGGNKIYSGSVGQLTKSQLKSISSLENQIAKHETKLAEYIKDPMKFDNKGILKNAPNDAIRQKIIRARINHLQQEIKTFQNNIQKILNGQ